MWAIFDRIGYCYYYLAQLLKVPPCYTRQRRQCTLCHYMAITWSLVATLCASVSYWPTVTLYTAHGITRAQVSFVSIHFVYGSAFTEN